MDSVTLRMQLTLLMSILSQGEGELPSPTGSFCLLL